MPDATPIYEFPYPCPDDVISPAAFSDLANAIDAKLNELATQEQETLFRPSFELFGVTNTAAAGVVKVTTGTESSVVAPLSAVYMVTAEASPQTGGVSVDAIRLRVRLAGTPFFGNTINHVNDGGLFPSPHCTGMLIATAGDLIDTDFLFTGSGNLDYRVDMTIKMICVVP